jgi:hypothetical protein
MQMGIASAITIDIALLALLLGVLTVVRFAVSSNFLRARLIMTALFCFVVMTLSISFWPYAAITLPYTIPTWVVGTLIGYFFGVTTERQKLATQGVVHYMEHFAHIHIMDIAALNWWAVINFYTVLGGLFLVNLLGFSTVILKGSVEAVIITSMAGAFMIGTIVPYLLHLWSVSARHHSKSTTSEA